LKSIFITIGFVLLGSRAFAQGTKKGPSPQLNQTYLNLMKPIDIFSPPPDAKKLLSLKDLYTLVRTQGVTLKVAAEDLNQARQAQRRYKDSFLPSLNLSLSNKNDWNESKLDSDLTDDYQDRDATTKSKSNNQSLGLNLSGILIPGINYSISGPAYSRSKTDPETNSSNPRRPEKAEWSGTLGVELLKDSPLFVQSLKTQKDKLEYSLAKENFRASTLAALYSAEVAFYGLIKNYLSLVVTQRSNELAKSLENEVKEKIAAGESSEIDAMRASLQSSTSETELMSAQIEYERAVEEFRNSLSYEGGDSAGIYPDPKAIDVDLSKLVLPSLAEVEDYQKQNPDVIKARISEQAAQVSLDLAKKAMLPSLKLSADYRNSTPGERWQETIGESVKPNDRNYSVGLTYSQNIYNNPASNDLRDQAVAKQKAVLAIDRSEKEVTKTFNSLLKRLEIGTRRLNIATTSRVLAEKKLQSEFEKFKYGESSVRDVIDSQTEVNSSRITEINARIDVILGHSELRTLAGKFPSGVTMSQSKGVP
jgi:outer membrane protein TolC